MDDRTSVRRILRDPVAEVPDDSLWLGGEAMVAPYAQFTAATAASDDGFADPDWQVL